MAVASDLKREWQTFKHDRPGCRFEHQCDRMRNGSRKLMYLQVALGVLLLAGGVVLLFIPGPGLLLIVFGLGLVAGLSRPLARALDRMEPPVRDRAVRAKRRWEHLPIAAKGLLIAGAVVAGCAAMYAMYRLWFA